jgi:hypothetical protein
MYLLLAFNWNSWLGFHRASGLGNLAGAVPIGRWFGYRAVECRTYGAPQDFLRTLATLANFMRLSLLKAAHADLGGATYRKSGSESHPTPPQPFRAGLCLAVGPPGLASITILADATNRGLFSPGQLSVVPAGLVDLHRTDPGLPSWATFRQTCPN